MGEYNLKTGTKLLCKNSMLECFTIGRTYEIKKVYKNGDIEIKDDKITYAWGIDVIESWIREKGNLVYFQIVGEDKYEIEE